SARWSLSPPGAAGVATDVAPAHAPTHDTADPYERPDPGALVPEEAWASMSGLDVMRALIDGSLAPPPIHHLTGMMPTSASDGEAAFRLPATEWLCSPLGRVE